MKKEELSQDPSIVLNNFLRMMIYGNLQSVEVYMEYNTYYVGLTHRIAGNFEEEEGIESYHFDNNKIELDKEVGENLLYFLLLHAEEVRTRYNDLAMAGLWETRHISMVRSVYKFPLK